MKKSHIFGIVVIAAAIMVIISTAGDASIYVGFAEAKEMAHEGDSKKIHVVGQLKKDAQGEIVGIQDSPNKLAFSFILVDNNNEEQRVYFNEPMPADFLRSEQVVVVGNFQNDHFLASKILMKCPSKYQEETIEVNDV
ncbi:cytochrome c maturation protein CcmE [Reichenbachiella agarivorans]|uniref:Cytochrome c maturation protein CcmE n=1 Tax=Reichenbachiella agarivorans TaxID=2979464 RepID=A0ABY6CZB1_9BACT|nr:cytochrome c maturation protein CcmE [Reichenbachiella agarivorans]UXP33570.1 cytochrome c maturation protein CcmE [Reichenbachiella agarivorans]